MKWKKWLVIGLVLLGCASENDSLKISPVQPNGPTSEKTDTVVALAADCIIKDGSAPNTTRIRPKVAKESSGKNVDVDWLDELSQVSEAVDTCKVAVAAGAPMLEDHLRTAESDLIDAYLAVLRQPDLAADHCWDDDCLFSGRDGAAKRFQIYMVNNAKDITPEIGRAIRAAYKLGTYEKLLLWESDKETYSEIRSQLCKLIADQEDSKKQQIVENPPRLLHGLKDRKKKPRGSRLECSKLVNEVTSENKGP